MLMNLPLMSMSMLDIFGINIVTIIYLVLCINFAKIYTDSEIVLSTTLLFDMMLSLMKIFHLVS